MSKPVLQVTLKTVDGQTVRVNAVFDSGSYYTIVREGSLPPDASILRYAEPEEMKTAAAGGKLQVTGATQLVVTIGDRMIRDDALLSPDLGREILIGAKTMQAWDISIQNRDGKTDVVVGRDMRDPEITEVD